MGLDVSLNYRVLNTASAAVHHRSAVNVLWLVLSDIVAFGLAGLLMALWGAGQSEALIVAGAPADWVIAAGFALLLLFFQAARGRYTSRATGDAQLRMTLTGAVGALLACLLLSTAIGGMNLLAIGEFSLFWAAAALLLCVFREATQGILAACGCWGLRTMVIGPEAMRAKVMAALGESRSLGIDIVRWVQPKPDGALDGNRWIHDNLRHSDVDLVVLADLEASDGRRAILRDLVKYRLCFGAIQPADMPRDFAARRYLLGDNLALNLGLSRIDLAARLLTKRVFEIALAVVLLIMLLPLFVVFAAIIRLDGGSTFYGHVRVGRGGQPFRCLKFRSMVHNSREVLDDLLARDPAAAAEWAKDFKLKNDPRVTKLGRFLRSSSLDELPQILNVLRGDMSFVGPRPIVEAEIERYREEIDLYYLVRPGITGLWQVSGRNDVSYGERVAFDAQYVMNWSLRLDLMILLNTVPVVLRKSGAY